MMRAGLEAAGSAEGIAPTRTDTAVRVVELATTLRQDERRRLTAAVDRVRRHVLQEFPRLGRAPLRHEIAEAFGLALPEVDRILARLHSSDFIYLDSVTREIQVAYPFSTVQTKHRVRLASEAKSMFAQCAVDALGIPFMFGTDISINSSCEHCGKPQTIEVKDGVILRHQPSDMRVWVGTARSAHAATSVCPCMNFFCSADHVWAWQQAHPEQVGEVLSLGEALFVGKGIFEGELKAGNNRHGLHTAQGAPARTTIAVSSAGGVFAAVLASVCCLGPLLFAALGVGAGATGFLAGTAGILKLLLPYRPLFIGLSALTLGAAFYLAYKKGGRPCASPEACHSAPVNRSTRTILWILTVIAVVLVLAPYWLAVFGNE